MAPTHQADWSPSDWPEALQELRKIDNLLRCSICYEYFDTAVLFKECSHNYCSLCIRRAMVYDPQCPTCFEKTSGNDLKCNRVLDELVKSFVNIRPKLLDIINKALVQSIPEKKDNIEMSDDSASNFEITPRRLRMNLKTKSKKGKSPCLTPRNKRKRPKLINSDSDDNDDEDVKESQAMDIDPLKSPTHTSQAPAEAAPASFVECPVCGELISSDTINSHLDFCLISGEKKSSLRRRKKATDTKLKQEPDVSSSSMKSPQRLGSHSSSSTSHKTTKKIAGANEFISAGPKRKPIPGIVYAILSDKQLKQKLKEWNLSTQGDRKTLIKRHQEFVVAYNAQCDSVNPKPVKAIVKELEIKEKRKTTNLLNAASTGPNLNINRDASEEQVDKVHKQYLHENQGQFEKLINEVKKRKKQESKPDNKSTRSVVIIDDEDSKQDDKTESENTVQLQPQNQEVNNESSVDDKGSVVTSPRNVLDSALKIRRKKQNYSRKNSSSVVNSQKNDIDDSQDKNASQLQLTENPGNQTYSNNSSPEVLRQDEICLSFQATDKSEKQVPEPPLVSNLASLNERDSGDEDDVDDKDGTDDGDDSGGGGGDDSDETEDNDNKSDQDWEMTPAFGIASSDEKYNEDENGESDEDLFATTPRQQTKTRSLRRKKK